VSGARQNGGAAGHYGAGSGGQGGGTGTPTNPDGAQGLIVVTYNTSAFIAFF
jgi:hypothetical protein